ncbi:MAG: cytochrome C [Campylobacterales bacterium]|nr:cytochrome C [Campylobacterales bacterium]
MKKITTAIVALGAATLLSAAVSDAACKGCHGQNWEKHAMGKSKVVAEMTHDEIATTLKGYKAGTYGGPMKGLMKGQVSKYEDTDLEAFAQTIGK